MPTLVVPLGGTPCSAHFLVPENAEEEKHIRSTIILFYLVVIYFCRGGSKCRGMRRKVRRRIALSYCLSYLLIMFCSLRVEEDNSVERARGGPHGESVRARAPRLLHLVHFWEDKHTAG